MLAQIKCASESDDYSFCSTMIFYSNGEVIFQIVGDTPEGSEPLEEADPRLGEFGFDYGDGQATVIDTEQGLLYGPVVIGTVIPQKGFSLIVADQLDQQLEGKASDIR